MKSVTEKIFDNKAGFVSTAPQNPEFRKCEEEYNRVYHELENTLNEEQKKLLNELDIRMVGIQGVMEELYFRKGLATGLRLGFEACSETDVLNTDEL